MGPCHPSSRDHSPSPLAQLQPPRTAACDCSTKPWEEPEGYRDRAELLQQHPAHHDPQLPAQSITRRGAQSKNPEFPSLGRTAWRRRLSPLPSTAPSVSVSLGEGFYSAPSLHNKGRRCPPAAGQRAAPRRPLLGALSLSSLPPRLPPCDLRVPLLALTVRYFCPTDYNSLWAIIQLPSPGPAAFSPNIISFMHILSVSLLSGIISELNFSPAILA